jgi:glycosyltransferase involved in cell wall biosynthesis
MKVRIERSVCVITPTIGEDSLADAMHSVRNQTYGNITHLIVADGPEYASEAFKGCTILDHTKTKFTTAPYNTGANGYYGHRIYAAYPHLIDHDYVCFLDADNWYEPNHVESLVSQIEKQSLDWAYSLRSVYLDKERFLAKDCCESIGKWPVWFSRGTKDEQYLVDTSAFCFKREFLINVCNHWHSGWGGDRRFLHIIKQMGFTNYDTTGLHTLNYVLPDMQKAYGGDLKFFEKGNENVKKHYGGTYPWLKT